MNYIKSDLLPIETERLLLRLLEPEEAGLMLRYVTENRKHLVHWEPVRSEGYYTEPFWRNELVLRQNDFYTGVGVRLAIFPKGPVPAPVIGVCNYSDILRGAFQACFLGYSVHCEFQGNGIMLEALSAANDFLFNTFRVHRIMANYMPRNERSGRLLKKLGFTVEGYARDYIRIAGKWEDHILTSKISNLS